MTEQPAADRQGLRSQFCSVSAARLGESHLPLQPQFCLLQKGDRPILTWLLMKDMRQDDMRVPVWDYLKLFSQEGKKVP